MFKISENEDLSIPAIQRFSAQRMEKVLNFIPENFVMKNYEGLFLECC